MPEKTKELEKINLAEKYRLRDLVYEYEEKGIGNTEDYIEACRILGLVYQEDLDNVEELDFYASDSDHYDDDDDFYDEDDDFYEEEDFIYEDDFDEEYI